MYGEYVSAEYRQPAQLSIGTARPRSTQTPTPRHLSLYVSASQPVRCIAMSPSPALTLLPDTDTARSYPALPALTSRRTSRRLLLLPSIDISPHSLVWSPPHGSDLRLAGLISASLSGISPPPPVVSRCSMPLFLFPMATMLQPLHPLPRPMRGKLCFLGGTAALPSAPLPTPSSALLDILAAMVPRVYQRPLVLPQL